MMHGPEKAWISQSALDEFRRLKAEMSRIGKRYRELQQWLLSSSDQGFDMEAGPLAFWVRETPMRRMSFEKVAIAIGRKNAEQLRARVPLTVSRQIVIASSDEGLAPRPDVADDEPLFFDVDNYG
jgi:hypothetical protein